MRSAMPLRWIEQAEEREVLTAALFETTPKRSGCGAACAALADWLARARSWLVPDAPVMQPQPALVRRRDGDEGYCRRW